MPKFLEVEFNSIGKTRMYVPPNTLIYRILEKRFPYPPVPVITETTKLGKEIPMEIDDDPVYLKEKETVRETRGIWHERYQLLLAFADLVVPEDWPDADVIRMVRIFDPDWEPQKTTDGLKLDYIERCVFWDPVDEGLYEVAMSELLGLDLDLAAFFRGAIRSSVEGEADPPLDKSAG